MLKIFRAGLLSGAALVVMSGAAFAADLGGGSLKDAPAPAPEHTITVNGGFTSDYVFRGISQSDNDPAVFAGADLAYRMFYVGVWGSSVADFTSTGGLEFDAYAGIKPSLGGVDFDFGVIYYAYPGADATVDLNYVELKAAASTKIRDITVTGTVFWSPDTYAESGDTWTFEGKVAAPLPFWGLTFGGAVGFVSNEGAPGFVGAYGDDSYTYWNAGLSKTFREHFTVDVRYWGTDNVEDPAPNAYAAGDRVLGSFTFNY